MKLTFLAALLGAALLIGTSAPSASASYGRCDAGEFCMWFGPNQWGGIYQFGGNDPNLHNDRFERIQTSAIVGNNTASVRNKGTADPGGRIDVVVFTEPQFRGSGGCIRRGAAGNLPAFWQNKISSYAWVTRGACGAYFQIPLL